MADMKDKKLNDNEMEQVSGGSILNGAPTPKFKVGDRVVVRGYEDKMSTIKTVIFTGDIVFNSYL